MALLITCPVCGPRNGYEFRFGGEDKGPRPSDESLLDPEAWCEWVHLNRNLAGPQREWWFHRDGCGTWFAIVRDTEINRQIALSEADHDQTL
jgi:sarcosine oxidase subunit delta